MLNVKSRQVMSARFEPADDEGAQFDLSRLVSAVKRERRLLAIWVACLLGLGIAYILTATPMFKAQADIFIDTETSHKLEKSDLNSVDTPAITDTSLVDSQVEVLTSDGLARDVVRTLGLENDPEFVGPKPGLIGWISRQVGAVMALFSSSGGGVDDPLAGAVDTFSRNLVVKRTGLTYVITITYWSESPTKAALIANTVADTFLRQLLQAKYDAAKQTGAWLEERMEDLRKHANDAANAVETFKAQNNIIDTNHGLMNEQQLGEMNSQLAIASAAVAEASGRLEKARDILKDPLSNHTTSEALNNSVFSRLRAQYLDLESRAGELTARYGADHSAVVNIRTQMAEIKKSATEQLKQILSADENDYLVARSREDSLRRSIGELVTRNDKTGMAQVRLKELQNTADTLQTIYTTSLQKYQELIQRSSFPVSDARITSPAVPPLKKSSPKTMLALAACLVLGGFLGVGHILARELTADTFLVADEVQNQTGLPCLGLLPAVVGAGKDQQPSPSQVDNQFGLFPHSRFAETLRTVKVALDAAPIASRCKVVAVTSAVPGEGKTAVAVNLARLLAASGARTILIDADFTRRSLSRRVASNARSGVVEILEGKALLDKSLVRRSPNDPDILACTNRGRVRNRAEILQSQAFSDFFDHLRTTYDYVVVDMAPVIPVVDTRIAASLVDVFLFVIEWGATSRKVVAEALELDAIRERTLGVVLNKADSEALKSIESYRGKAYNSYYV